MEETKGRLYNKKILFLFIVLLTIILVRTGYHWQKQQSAPNSLFKVLNYYGIQTSKEKEALLFLMIRSGILKSKGAYDYLFPSRDNKDDLLGDILKFVQLTQQYFTIRTGMQERWEVKAPQWMKQNETSLLKSLNTLGLIRAIGPKFPKTDAICILGSTAKSMNRRLKYAADLCDAKKIQAKHLVLLVGERRVTIGVDGTEVQLGSIAQKYGISISDLTETHMMKEAYNHSALFAQLPTDIIDTPVGNLPRPTTETTMQAFCKWLKGHPGIRKVTFVSNQPHIKYQEAVIRETLRQQGQIIQFEVVGPEASQDAEIQDLVGALGSQIWAQTPDVLAKMKLTTPDPKLREAFLALYAKQPLIYNNVRSLLQNE